MPKPASVTVTVWKGKGRQPWRFTATAKNGAIVAASEGYLTKWNATRAARKVFPDATIKQDG